MHFLSFSQIPNTIEDVVYKKVPGGFDSLHIHPGLRLGPQKDLVPRNVVLEHRPTAVRPNSGEPTAGTGRERAEGDLRGP
jgi:hypothetical protein